LHSSHVIWVIKTRRRWVRHVACMGERRAAYRVLMGKLKERDNMEGLSISGRIIMKRFFKK